VALPLVLIRHLSLWYDEFFSVFFAAQGPAYLLHEGWARETSPPLYYLLLWFWTEIFGQGEAAVRSLSLIAHIATLPVVFAIARRLAPGPAAWRAVIFYTFGAAMMQYAVMARTYSVWMLPLALATLALVSGTRALESPGSDWRCLKAGIGFAAASVVALYLHDTTIIFAAAADAAFLAVWWWRRGGSWRDLAAWFGPQIAALAATVPQLVVIAAQMHSPNINWIPPVSVINVFAAALDLLGGPAYPIMLLRTIAAAVVLGAFLWGAAMAIKRRSSAVVLVILTVAGFGLLCLVSVWRPILLARTALWLMVPVSVVAAAAFDRIPAGLTRLVAFLGLAGLLFANAGLGFWLSWQEPWRDIVKSLAANKTPTDVVVVMNATPITAFLYYAPGAAGWDMRRWSAVTRSQTSSAFRALEARLAPTPATSPGEIVALLRQGRAVWLVSRLSSQIGLHEAFDAQAQPGSAPTLRLQRGSLLLSRLAPPAR
jgi:uncharacterized membrane protein